MRIDTRTKTEKAIDNCNIKTERLAEIWKDKSPYCELDITKEEEAEIDAIWDTMDGSTCFMTAFFAAWNRKEYLKSIGL